MPCHTCAACFLPSISSPTTPPLHGTPFPSATDTGPHTQRDPNLVGADQP